MHTYVLRKHHAYICTKEAPCIHTKTPCNDMHNTNIHRPGTSAVFPVAYHHQWYFWCVDEFQTLSSEHGVGLVFYNEDYVS